MNISLIQAKLLTYQCKTVLEQEHALKEITQEIALLALSRAGFFRIAAFQGGTCLRILYGLERFSEDLDFVLRAEDKTFVWNKYISNMHEEFIAYGFNLEVKDRAKYDSIVKTAFLKADSAGGILLLKDIRTNQPKLKIKLEIDTHPPEGSLFENKYLDFPSPCSIQTQDLPSLFAGKCHALLCRNYTKGRDWYDFIWYIQRQTQINFTLLQNAIQQAGPWKDKHISVTRLWFLEKLKHKISAINWEETKQDVAPFLREKELIILEHWSEEFFLSCVEKLARYLI